jgi:large subunit ribosomal protein L15
MQIHEIQPKARSTRKRVGRGGKRGTYSGKGMKGQLSRSGNNREPIIRSLVKRYHKLRGYRFNPKQAVATSVTLEVIDKNFKAGEVVNPRTLIEKKVISKMKNRIPIVKILSNGELTKKLVFEGCKLSKQTEEKINKIK